MSLENEVTMAATGEVTYPESSASELVQSLASQLAESVRFGPEQVATADPGVTAKIICQTKIETGEGDDRTVNVSFLPDYADGRNKEWARWTPGLSLTMGLRGAVADRFEVGRAYLLTFTEDRA